MSRSFSSFRSLLFTCPVLVPALLMGSFLQADEGAKTASAGRTEQTERGHHTLKPFSKDFLRLSKLAGRWKGEGKDEQGEPAVFYVEYRLTSGNSVLVETLMQGTPMEMVSLYHDDGDALMMTHYCGLGNQPRMRTSKITDKQFVFTFVDGSNMASAKEMHMGALTMTIVDSDHIRHDWTLFVDGKPTDQHQIMEMTRVR